MTNPTSAPPTEDEIKAIASMIIGGLRCPRCWCFTNFADSQGMRDRCGSFTREESVRKFVTIYPQEYQPYIRLLHAYPEVTHGS